MAEQERITEADIQATIEGFRARGQPMEREQVLQLFRDRGFQIESGDQPATPTPGRAEEFTQEFAPGAMEVEGLKALGAGLRQFLGGPPGGTAPAPELAPPGMIEALEAPPNVQRAALATAGAAAAPVVAATTRAPLIAAEPLTAVVGEVLGQKAAGAKEPINAVLAGAMPVGMRALMRAGRGAARFAAKRLPGAAAGQQEEAIEQGRQLLQSLRPQDLDTLRAITKTFDNLEVPVANLRRATDQTLRESDKLIPRLRPAEARRISQEVDNLISATENEALPLRQFRDNLEEIGAEIGRLRRATEDRTGLVRGASRNLRALRKVYASALNDLDSLPGAVPAILDDYRQALRKDFAVTDLERIIERAIDTRQGDGLTFIKPRMIRRSWRQAKDSGFLRESFTPVERAQVDAFIDDLATLPPLPRPSGVAAGSAMALTRTAGAGGIATGITGDPQLGALAAGVAAVTPRVIARMLMTEPGRRLIRRTLSTEGFIRPDIMGALAGLARVSGTSLAGPENIEQLGQQLLQALEPPRIESNR